MTLWRRVMAVVGQGTHAAGVLAVEADSHQTHSLGGIKQQVGIFVDVGVNAHDAVVRVHSAQVILCVANCLWVMVVTSTCIPIVYCI